MIKKVVLTGGPGSGKTTVIEGIKNSFSNKLKVIIVDETASYLINMGIRPFGDDKVSMLDFQELVLRHQLEKEDLINRSIEMLPNENILIIYDRGILDNCAYISEEEFNEILSRLYKKYTINDLLERYDLVLNLVSRRDFYTCENNPARSEGVEEALRLGNKTLTSWIGHKNIKIVSPKDNIEDKINEVINHINNILEEHEIKYQEKYLVDKENTNLQYLKQISKKAVITQDYLESIESVEKRLRKVVFQGTTTYNYTVYKTLEDGTKVKISDEAISEKMYHKLLDFKDQKRKTIKKNRYYFSYNNEYFILDELEDYLLLEINVKEDYKITIPPYITVIENVTKNPLYLNKNIASKSNLQYQKK